ncbi:MAG TPA: hypothetical protein VGI40_22765 [Pirellulaceae bacterium]
MEFRRSGPLDERRRRVLMDEIAAPADGDADAQAAGSAKGPVRAYHEAVLSQRQPKVTDLLPVRPLWVVVLMLAGLTGIAAIEAIHVHAVSLPAIAGSELLAPLNADCRGSLAAWYSSAMLAAAAALAIVVFSIRAHRIDDYRGRYRIWLWTAAALTWLSLDAATGIHSAIGLALNLVTGQQVVTTSVTAASMLTWIVVYGLVFGALGMRLVFELWNSRLSLTALLVAGFLYCDAALLELEIIQAPANLISGTLESTLTLLAHFSLLAAVGFYARHVLLDASGRLKVHIDTDRKGNKSKRSKLKVVKAESKQRSAATPQPTTTNPHQGDAPPRASSSYQSTAAPNSMAAKSGVTISKNNLTSPDGYDDEEDDDNYGDSNLSKSERRRLKKLARREQQRRAA